MINQTGCQKNRYKPILSQANLGVWSLYILLLLEKGFEFYSKRENT